MFKSTLILLSTLMLLQASNAESVHMQKKTVQDGFNKYSHLMHKEDNWRSSDPQTPWEYLKLSIMGKTNEQKLFEEEADRYFANRESKKQASFGKGHLGSHASVILDNPGGFMWVGEVIMGTNYTSKISVVFDTGSDWLVIPGENCTSCEGRTYPGEYYSYPMSDVSSERHYGTASLYGREYFDRVCINSNITCVEYFDYFLIEDQIGLTPPIEGILGMSQNITSAMGGKAFVDVGPLYVDHLHRQGQIKTPMFSFYMSTFGQSRVDFGVPDSQGVYMGDLDFIRKIPMEKDFFWSQHVDATAYHDIDNGFAFDGPKYAIFDTGSSHIFVPNNYFKPILNQIGVASGNPDIIVQDGVAIAPCQAEWTPVSFLFQGYWIQIDPSGYLFDISENGDGSLCHIAFISNEFDFFLFGLPLFQNYYVVHDMDGHNMGWIPIEGSGKFPLHEGRIPAVIMIAEDSESHWLVQLLVVLIIIACLCGLICVYPVLEANNLTSEDDDFWAWWICYSCCCCICITFTWVSVAVAYVATLPVNDEYTPEDAYAEGGAGQDTSGKNYDYSRVVSLLAVGATAAFTFKQLVLKAKPTAQ